MSKRRTFSFDGLGVSGGIAIGPAYVLEMIGGDIESRVIAESETEAEVARFHRAVEMAVKELSELGKAVREHIDTQQAAIFDAHAALLSDPLWINKTEKGIRQDRRNAEFVFWSVTQEIGNKLKALATSSFSERSHDLYDVARRVLKFLRDLKAPESHGVPKGAIVVADELGPSETAALQRDHVAGFCTNAGGATSHTAIMAKALQLPAVIGLDFITHYVKNGDQLVLDGTEGKVIVNPTSSQVEKYRERLREYEKTRVGFEELRDLPAVTTDGVRIALEANIEFSHELPSVLSNGAEGIGLYRTEYFFIDRAQLPTEEEQEKDYAQVMAEIEGPVVFRTLDVGGDKLAHTLGTQPESNPFLGLRAIRLCLAYPDLFRKQLRPMMRAARGRELNILLPMICCTEEIHQARKIIDQVYNEVEAEGKGTPSSLKIGAMIEIPSAALRAEVIAREVDFLSIGTNDLVQYTLAVDRTNKLVGNLYQELHPSVLQLISHVVKVSEQTGKPLAVCGEMAGNPLVALLLIGLGIRRLSMSPLLIGPVKQAVRSIDAAFLADMAERLLPLPTALAVREGLLKSLGNYARTSSQPAANQ